ncbi:MAG: dethiobiotin synthase [Litorimonas sp.]
MNFTVAGIGTDVGKTVISAILCEALNADYWKPVQAGDLHHSDSDKVKALVDAEGFKTHTETYRLTEAISPHAAAQIDDVQIKPADFKRPNTQGRNLITELAGGLMVPFSDNYLTIDLVQDLGDPVILVVNSYLGSINHTLLSLELLRQRNIFLFGVIFNGDTNPESREIILQYSGVRVMADIPRAERLDRDFIKTHAQDIARRLNI